MTKRIGKTPVSGPDLRDAEQAINSLAEEYGLHFRSTFVLRNGRFLARGYAHNGTCLSDSDKVYQTYKQYDLSAGPLIAHVVYFLAFDLYWQAQSDATPVLPASTPLLELP